MFQIEPILFLQSLASDACTAFMSLVSQMGYTPFYVAILSFVLFGVSFRKGFILTQMVLWTGIFTDLLKNVFALPRPSDVDSAVQLLGKEYANPTPFTGMGAQGFFGLPGAEAIQYFRKLPEWSFGFPSGHVGGTATLWGGMSLLFRKRWIWILGAIICILMPISRMYLGRHFLADVLGAFLFSGIIVLIVHHLVMKEHAPLPLQKTTRLLFHANPKIWLLTIGLLLPPLLLLFLTSMVEPDDAGRLFGMNAAFLVIGASGFPDDVGSVLKRILRFLLSPILFFLSQILLGKVVDLSPINEDHACVEFILSGLVTFIMLWGTVWLSLRMGLYKRPRE